MTIWFFLFPPTQPWLVSTTNLESLMGTNKLTLFYLNYVSQFVSDRESLFCLRQRVTFFSDRESTFFCFRQRVTFIYWYEIGGDAVTFFLWLNLRFRFNKARHIYHKEIYLKFHKDWLRGCGDMGGKKFQRNPDSGNII